MSIKLWNKKNRAEADDDQVFLRLVEDSDDSGDLILAAVDKAGDVVERGKVLLIHQDSKAIILNGGLGNKVPFNKDFFGHVIHITGQALANAQAMKKVHQQPSVHIIGLGSKDCKEHENTDE